MGGKKGLAGVTKGMVAAVAGGAIRGIVAACTRDRTWRRMGVQIALDVPVPGGLVQHPIVVVALVACARVWAVHVHVHVLLLDDAHAITVLVVGRNGRLRGRDGYVGGRTSASTRLTSFVGSGHGSVKGG